MTGLGLIVAFIGYAILYWGLQAIQLDTSQPPFMDYLFPWRNQ